jgi:DNA-binding MarR family transcriptional regulator
LLVISNNMKVMMKQVIEKYMLMVEKISSTTRMSQTFGTDVEIYRSEIHVMQLIDNYGHLHVSEIARRIGVTKGAVSQILKKLEHKDLVQKYRDTTNNTRQQVRLTSKGVKACEGHKNYHSEHDKEMFDFLENLNEHDLSVIENFMGKAIHMVEGHF